jgi:hypothetical protein
VREQESVPEIGRVQVPPEENVPALELVKVTVPPGRRAVPESVSETVAVQVEAEFTGTEDGEQVTEVPEVRFVTVTLASPWLPEWSTSPAYVPVRV